MLSKNDKDWIANSIKASVNAIVLPLQKQAAQVDKTRILVGRYGATEINDTKVALNMLDDQIKDYKDRKTHTKVR